MTDSSQHYATAWEAIADRMPERPALAHGERRMSWATFEQRSARLAAALQNWGYGTWHFAPS